MKIKSSIFLVIFCFVMCSSSIAYATVTETKTLIASYVEQDMPNWCWAASAENSVIWEANPSRTQWDAVRHLKGNLLDPFPDVPGGIGDSEKAAEYISQNTISYSSLITKWTYSVLKAEIKNNNHCVIVASGFYNGSNRFGGHAVLINGYEYGTTTSDNKVTYYDSLDDSTYTCTYTSFCDGSFNGARYDQTCWVN